MALTDESMVMPVAPMYGNSNSNDIFGGSGWWILLLFILLGNGGWGSGFGMDGGLYPWLNNSQNINGGFRDQMLGSQIQGIQNSITSGFGDVQTALCGGFAGVNATINGAQNAVTSQMYANQIADMERSFAAQTASTQGMTALQAQLAQCCCDNRSATQDLKYTVASENCSDRTQALQNTRGAARRRSARERGPAEPAQHGDHAGVPGSADRDLPAGPQQRGGRLVQPPQLLPGPYRPGVRQTADLQLRR